MKAGREAALVTQIRAECEMGLSFAMGRTREGFLADALVQHAVAMTLVIAGESVAKLASACPEFAEAHP